MAKTNREFCAEFRARKLESGECLRCGDKPQAGQRLCATHVAWSKVYQKMWRDKHKDKVANYQRVWRRKLHAKTGVGGKVGGNGAGQCGNGVGVAGD